MYEAEDGSYTGSTQGTSVATGGVWIVLNDGSVSETSEVTFGLLLEGAYIALSRVGRNSGTHTATHFVLKAGTAIESYGENTEGADVYTPDVDIVTPPNINNEPLAFQVDDETASYSSKIASTIAQTIFHDSTVLIPVSNGKDFIMDIYHQLMQINNNRQVGITY